MNDSAVIRLFHMGLPGQTGEPYLAASITPEELARSPLALPDASDGNDAGTGWTLCGKGELVWLERPCSDLPAPLYLTGATSSSLDVAKTLLAHGLFPEWSSILCLSQSAGRGQMRRQWTSPAGNLYAALRLPLEGPFASFAAAPAIGGLVAEALNAEGFPVQLKWPNDLLQPAAPLTAGRMPGREDCHKVGGILLEERFGALTAGIGLNIASAPPTASLRDNYAFSAGTLTPKKDFLVFRYENEKSKKSEELITIFTLWKHLVARIFSCYGCSSTPTRWWPALAEKHLAFRDCQVSLADACPEDDSMVRVPCVGIVDGVTSSGALRLRTGYGIDTFLGGSLLPGDLPHGEYDV